MRRLFDFNHRDVRLNVDDENLWQGEQRGIAQGSALVGTEDCVFESP